MFSAICSRALSTSTKNVSQLRKILKPFDPYNPPRIKPQDYARSIKMVQDFFEQEGLQHSYAQNDMKLLAACEDANNIAATQLGGRSQAIMQTGQMALEADIMGNREVKEIVDNINKYQGYDYDKNKRLCQLAGRGNIFAIEALEQCSDYGFPKPFELPKGYFAHNTSTRNESRAGDGRREFKFPLTEFEFINQSEESGFDELAEFISKLLVHLGFEVPKLVYYDEECQKFGTKFIEDEEEQALCDKYGSAVLLGKFPLRSDPYWNMRHVGNGIFDKIDVIIHGFESAGTAVRSCNPAEMKINIHLQDSGDYIKAMYKHFGEDRVDAEIDEYTDYKFIPRCGGGLGMSRIIRGMKLEGLL